MKLSTLCYIECDNKYLMLYRNKKKQDVNKGKWIGVGGHFERGESPDDCLLREVKEETNLTLLNYSLRGIITFIYNNDEEELIFLYTSDRFEGSLSQCSEGELKWVDKQDIPSLSLWAGDRIFLKLLNEDIGVFSLKLVYNNDELINAALNNKMLSVLNNKFK